MKTHEKIRLIRELRKWSQEDMAEKLELSINGYSKIERGETQLTVPRLQQIAEILDIDVNRLIQDDGQDVVILIGENSAHCLHSSINMYGSGTAETIAEIEKLKLVIQHKDELLTQKERELADKEEIIKLLRQTQN